MKIQKDIMQTKMFEHLEDAIALYVEMVYENAIVGKANKSTVEALESLVRTWETLHTTAEAFEASERLKKHLPISDTAPNTAPKPPEMPFEFSLGSVKHLSKVRML